MYLKVTYDEDFDTLLMHLKSKYGNELFDMDGIGKQTDMNLFSRDFFDRSKFNTADVSVDSNANVDSRDIIAYNFELPKPFFRLNSYYLLWKKLRDIYGLSDANKIVEMQFTGDIYINDFNDISKPYSYHPHTVLVLKKDNKIIYTTMFDLFEQYKDYVDNLEDREEINLEQFNLEILDNNNLFIPLLYVLRHKPHTGMLKIETKNGLCTYVTEDHPIILNNDSVIDANKLTCTHYLKESTNILKLLETKNIDSNFAYFIGRLIGDGHVHYILHNNNNGITAKNINTCQITMYQKDIVNSHIWKIMTNLFGKTPGNPQSNKAVIYDKYFGLSLHDMGIETNSKRQKLPKDILEWNREAIISLLSGIIDSDGTIGTNSGIVEIKLTSFALVQQISELCKSLGMRRVRTSFDDTTHCKNSYGDEYKSYRVSFQCTDINFIKYCKKIENKKSLVFKNNRQIDGLWEESQVHKIISDESLDYVYDITTFTGKFHSQGLIQHNCFNYSTIDIMMNGLPMVKKIHSIAPKYLFSFKSQLEQFVVIASNSTLGATGLADIFIVMSYYIDRILHTGHDAGIYFDGWMSDKEKIKISKLINKIPVRKNDGSTDEEIEKYTILINKILEKDGPTNKDWFERNVWKYLKETLVSFIYTINQPMRGNQSPFTNVSIFDSKFLKQLCSEYVFFDGIKPNIKTIQKIQEIFIDTMNDELSRTPVTFPVTTACFSVDKDLNLGDEEFVDFIADKNLKFGFINLYCGKTSTLSSCCRLRSDTKSEYFNSFGAGSSKIGSLGVVTMNLPRLAMKHCHCEKNFYQALKELVICVAKINNAKRQIIKNRIENGVLPLYDLGYMELSKQYSTCGVNGLNESAEILEYNILTPRGQEFVLRCLDVINKTNELMEQNYKAPHNCEQVPAENSSIKLAAKDKIMGFKTKYNFYSNQFIPLTTNADLVDRITLQGLFDKHFSGGAIAHINVDSRLDDPKIMKNVIKICAKKGVVYCAINYNLQRCKNNHMSVGKGEHCQVCGAEITDNFTRVVGFLTNTKNWAKVRREDDYPNRQFYSVNTPPPFKNHSSK